MTAWEIVKGILIISIMVVPILWDLGLEWSFGALFRGVARLVRRAVQLARSRRVEPAIPRAIVRRRSM